MKDDRLYLIHMLECIARVEQYTKDGKAAFLADIKTQDAVIRNLQTLAESTQRISGHLRAAHPDVNWRGIIAFRNIAVHNYLGIRWELVWAIVENELPRLKPVLDAMVRHLDEADAGRQTQE